MIVFNVAQLLKQPTGATRRVAFTDSPQEFDPDVVLIAPVEGAARLVRTTSGVLVEASYTTRVRLECGRCLEPVETDLKGEISDEFLPSVSVLTGAPIEETAQSSELAIDANHQLDLTEVLRQDMLTRLPLQPLCDPACRGLCERCGAPLSAGDCGCPAPVAESAFARLAELLEQDKP